MTVEEFQRVFQARTGDTDNYLVSAILERGGSVSESMAMDMIHIPAWFCDTERRRGRIAAFSAAEVSGDGAAPPAAAQVITGVQLDSLRRTCAAMLAGYEEALDRFSDEQGRHIRGNVRVGIHGARPAAAMSE